MTPRPHRSVGGNRGRPAVDEGPSQGRLGTGEVLGAQRRSVAFAGLVVGGNELNLTLDSQQEHRTGSGTRTSGTCT
jgi:hypothetical protein